MKGRQVDHTQWLRRLLLVTATLASCLAPELVRGQFNVSLVPQVFEAKLRRGQRGEMSFKLTNQDANKALMVKAFLSEMRQGPTGQYLLSDTVMPYSCIPWLTLSDTLFTVPPGETWEIPVEVRVPTGVSGGAYGAIVFELAPDAARGLRGEPGLASLEYKFRLPAWIEITIESPRAARGRLTSGKISVIRTADNPKLTEDYGTRGMVVTADVTNTGDIHVFTKGRMIIRDEHNKLVRDTKLGSGRGAILPGASSRLQTITGLPAPGIYSIKAIVDYGGRSPAIAQTMFEVGSDQASTGASQSALPLYVDMRPEEFEPSIPAGGFRVLGVTLMNRESKPVDVNVRLGQVSFDNDGQMWVSEDNVESGRSCAPWTNVDPQSFTLQPEGRKNVRLTLRVPEDATGGYYTCLIMDTRYSGETSDSVLPTPMYCPVFLTVPPDLVYGGRIAEINIDHPKDAAVSITTAFQNTGNIHEILFGQVVLDGWTKPEQIPGLEVVRDTAKFEPVGVFRLETDSTYVLPGETRLVPSQIVDGLPEGRYRVRVVVAYGSQTPAIMEKEFVIGSPDAQEW